MKTQVTSSDCRVLDVHVVPLSWQRLVSLWLAWLETSGCTEATITCRYYKIGYIARLLGCDPFVVTGEMLVSVFASQSWARETRKGYSVTIRSFYRFLMVSIVFRIRVPIMLFIVRLFWLMVMCCSC